MDSKKINLVISIVIPTINRYSDLMNTIKYLQNQDLKDFELIIIDQSDITVFNDLSSLDSRIVHIQSDIKSASAARNKGLIKAKSDIVLFLDDDVIIENCSFLYHHVKPYFDNTNLSGIFGSVLELRVNQKPTLKRHKWSYNYHWGWLFFPQNYDKYTNIRSGRSCNLSVRKQFALNIGGMDENFEKGAHREEADFCERLTQEYGSLLFSPEARLVHIGNASGGVRTWDKTERSVQAQHHFDGAFYFIFKNVKLIHYFPHFLSIFFFFFYKKGYTARPKYFLLALYRTLKGIINAFNMLYRKPKYILN